jgi:hypothetical protein
MLKGNHDALAAKAQAVIMMVCDVEPATVKSTNHLNHREPLDIPVATRHMLGTKRHNHRGRKEGAQEC